MKDKEEKIEAPAEQKAEVVTKREELVPAFKVHDWNESPQFTGKFVALHDGGYIFDDGGNLYLIPTQSDLNSVIGSIKVEDVIEFVFLGVFSGVERFNINRIVED